MKRHHHPPAAAQKNITPSEIEKNQLSVKWIA